VSNTPDPDTFVQNPLETLTNVVQPATAKGHTDVPDALGDARKHRSTFAVVESASSNTSVAANEMCKGGHGLHEYTALLVEEPPPCVLKAANRGRAQRMRLPVNETWPRLWRAIKLLPVVLKSEILLLSDIACDGICRIVECVNATLGPTHKPAKRRTPSSPTH
jgi:hypothetical protein